MIKPDIDTDISKRALDELFSLTSLYRKKNTFVELMNFASKFRSYSPFNAMLIHVQNPERSLLLLLTDGSVNLAAPSRKGLVHWLFYSRWGHIWKNTEKCYT